MGVQGAHLNPLGLFLEPPGPLLTHLHTVHMAYSECLPTRLNPLAESTCFSQVWIPVTPSTEENGCLLVAPGSHLQGLVEHAQDTRVAFNRHAIPDALVGGNRRTLPMEPGSILLLHPCMMHASLPNRSDDIRWSLDIRYNPIGQPTGRPRASLSLSDYIHLNVLNNSYNRMCL